MWIPIMELKAKIYLWNFPEGRIFFFFTFLRLIKFTIAAYDKNLKVPH